MEAESITSDLEPPLSEEEADNSDVKPFSLEEFMEDSSNFVVQDPVLEPEIQFDEGNIRGTINVIESGKVKPGSGYSGLCVICNKVFHDPPGSSDDNSGFKLELKLAFSQCMNIPEQDARIVEELPCLCGVCKSAVVEWYRSTEKINELTLRTGQIQATLAAKVLESAEPRFNQDAMPVEVILTEGVPSFTSSGTGRRGKTIGRSHDNVAFRKIQRIRKMICKQYSAGLAVTRLSTQDIQSAIEKENCTEAEEDEFDYEWQPNDDYEDDVVGSSSQDLKQLESVSTAVSKTRRKGRPTKLINSVVSNLKSKFKTKLVERTRKKSGTRSHASEYGEKLGDGRREELRQVGPGQYMLGKYAVVEKDDGCVCQTCGVKCSDRQHISRHVRRCHLDRRPTKRTLFRCIPVGPDKYIYASKYPICVLEGKYTCGQCGFKNPNKYDLLAHIRRCHFPKTGKKKKTRSKGEAKEVAAPPEEVHTEVEGGASASAFESTETAEAPPPTPSVEESDPNIFPVDGDIEINPPEAPPKVCLWKEVEPGKFILGTFKFEKEGSFYRCNECLKTFAQKSDMVKHVRRHYLKKPDGRERNSWHPIEPNKYRYAGKFIVEVQDGKYVCPSCPFKTATRARMSDHIRSKHIHGIEKYICDQCGQECKDKDALKSHRAMIHAPIVPGAHVCTVCGKEFPRRLYLRNHMVMHSEEKKFQCEYCGKKFRRLGHFRSHIPLHTGERPFACNLCPMTFATSTTMYYHRKTVHMGEKKKTASQRRRQTTELEEQRDQFSTNNTSAEATTNFLPFFPPGNLGF